MKTKFTTRIDGELNSKTSVYIIKLVYCETGTTKKVLLKQKAYLKEHARMEFEACLDAFKKAYSNQPAYNEKTFSQKNSETGAF